VGTFFKSFILTSSRPQKGQVLATNDFLNRLTVLSDLDFIELMN
jgi:hypothetical protein